MILIHLCSTGQSFKHTYEKDKKNQQKKTTTESSVDISYIHCAIDTDHNKHVYIKTVKFLNQHFYITIEMVRNICMYHLRATLTAQ